MNKNLIRAANRSLGLDLSDSLSAVRMVAEVWEEGRFQLARVTSRHYAIDVVGPRPSKTLHVITKDLDPGCRILLAGQLSSSHPAVEHVRRDNMNTNSIEVLETRHSGLAMDSVGSDLVNLEFGGAKLTFLIPTEGRDTDIIIIETVWHQDGR